MTVPIPIPPAPNRNRDAPWTFPGPFGPPTKHPKPNPST